MEIEIKKTEFTRTVKTVKVTIPEKQMYLWHNGVREAYSVKPVWTTYKVEHHNQPEQIYELSVVSVYPSGKEIKHINLQIHDLVNILADPKNKYQRLVDNILNYPEDKEYIRTKEQFDADLKSVITEINEAVN